MWKKWWGRKPGSREAEESGGTLAPPENVKPERTEEDEALLNKISEAVVRWGMATPAIFMLESSKPLSFVGSQFLHFLSPIVHTALDAKDLDRLATLLEERETMEDLIRRIERADEDARAARKG